MTPSPLATIVVPVRNRSDLLRECLDGLMKQDLVGELFDVLVCDDGSTEDISAVIADFQSGPVGVRLLSQPPLGPAAARNLGIRNSHSPTLVFIDSDVRPHPEAVRRLVEALERNPRWCGAEATVEPTEGEDSPLWDAPTARGGRYLTAGIAYRRSALEQAGGFDEAFRLPACEDVELAVRVLQAGEIGYVPEAMILHPRRRITLNARWRWRLFWRYTVWLAARYGFLAWPGKRTRFPRLRTALAAVATLPLGRAIAAVGRLPSSPSVGLRALAHAGFDIVCGMAALPDIVLCRVPERRDYLRDRADDQSPVDQPTMNAAGIGSPSDCAP
jgi:GT2 family glycosyltransferase